MVEIFWKLLIMLLKCSKKDYLRAIYFRNQIYIVNIRRFVTAGDDLKKWKNAFERTKAQN